MTDPSGSSLRPLSQERTSAERIDEACDRFEAAWRSGNHPRIEAVLEGFAERERPALLEELLAIELELRSGAGEMPLVSEYLARFPADADLVRQAFQGATVVIDEPRLREDESTPIVGLLAVELGYLSRQDLDAALGDCEGPLGAHLVARGLLDEPTLSLIETFVGRLRAQQSQDGADPQATTELEATTAASPASPDAQTLRDRDRASTLDDGTMLRPSAHRPLPEVPGYEILAELGRGGMGVVYRARQVGLNRPCALKMILADEHASPESGARFLSEAQTVARLRHPNIVQIYALGAHGGKPFVELEYIEGGSLASRLEGAPWAPREAAKLVEMLARAVDEVHHQGVIHRDLKPANILLSADGTPKIADFGLAKARTADTGITRTQSILGSPCYMAPEQARGDAKRVGTAADVYSLGAILYELLTGRPPFRGATVLETIEQVKQVDPVSLSRLVPGTPRDIETICLKCLEKDSQRRYASAADLADDLGHFQRGEPISARPLGPLMQMGRWCKRHPSQTAVIGLAAFSLLAAALVSVGFAVYQGQAAEKLRNALNEARAQRRQADVHLADLAFERGVALCEQGDVDRGMLWLARGLEVATRAQALPLQRVLRANLAAWSRRFHPLRAFLEHEKSVTAIAYSPDASLILTGSEDRTARLWNTATGKPLGTPLLHDATVRSASFSPDGQFFVTLAGEGPALVWNGKGATSGRPLHHPGAITLAAFRPRSQTIVTAGKDGSIWFWEARSGKSLSNPLKQASAANVLVMSPDGRWMVTANADRTVHVWDLDSGRLRTAPIAHESAVRGLAISPDGETLLTGTEEGVGQLWRAATGEPIGPALKHNAGVDGAAFSPTGKSALTASRGWRVYLWDAATGKSLGPFLNHQAPVTAAMFSPDGRLILTACRDGGARIWNAATGQILGVPLRHKGVVLSAAFSPDGQAVLTAGSQSAAQLWEVHADQARTTAYAQEGWPSAMAFSADARLLAIGTELNEVRVWDRASGSLVVRIALANYPQALAFSKDGRQLITATDDRRVERWDAVTGKQIGATLMHPTTVRALTVSADGAFILTGSREGNVALWDTATDTLLRRVKCHDGPIWALAFTRDAKRFITTSGDQTARIWNSETMQPLCEPMMHQGQVWSAAFSPDARMVATGCGDKTVQLWDSATGTPIGAPLFHTESVRAVEFSPRGNVILVGGWVKASRLWDEETRKPISVPVEHSGAALAAVFDTSGSEVWLGCEDKTALLETLGASLEGSIEQIRLLTEVGTGVVLDPNGGAQLLDLADWKARQGRLADGHQ